MRTIEAKPTRSRLTRRRSTHRGEHGIIMLAAIGFLAVLGVVVAISMHMLESESAIQSQQLRERIAFYAAEAGLAEARSMIRAMWHPTDGFARVFAELTFENAIDAEELLNKPDQGDPYHMGGACNDTLGSGTPVVACLYRLSPRQQYSLRLDDKKSVDGLKDKNNAFAAYPVHDNVSFETFIYDDADQDNNFAQDSNRQFWVVSVGEVNNGNNKRPTRVTLRALVTGPRAQQSAGSYSSQKGGGASKLGVF